MRFTEFNISETVNRAIQEHITRGVPFTECMFRPGSEAFTMFYRRVKEMRESLDLDWQDQELLDTDIGECIMVEGELVPLDVPMIDEELDEDVPQTSLFQKFPTMKAAITNFYGVADDVDFAKGAFIETLSEYTDYHDDFEGVFNYIDNIVKRILKAGYTLEELVKEQGIKENKIDERKENPFQMDLTAYDFPADKDNRKYADPDDPDREQNKKGVSIQMQLRKSVSMNGKKDVEFANGEVVKVPRNIAIAVLNKIDKLKTAQDKFKIINIIAKSYEHLVAFAHDIKVTEAEYQGREVKLNSPKRGGSKKFYVYVKNPKTGRVKKISWGDTTGLSVKSKDPGRVRSFVARHKCKQANDKMTARYWSCRTPRYKSLGVKGGQWW